MGAFACVGSQAAAPGSTCTKRNFVATGIGRQPETPTKAPGSPWRTIPQSDSGLCRAASAPSLRSAWPPCRSGDRCSGRCSGGYSTAGGLGRCGDGALRAQRQRDGREGGGKEVHYSFYPQHNKATQWCLRTFVKTTLKTFHPNQLQRCKALTAIVFSSSGPGAFRTARSTRFFTKSAAFSKPWPRSSTPSASS